MVTGLDIEATGVESGDDLLEHIAEQGQNYFTDPEDASGGVNQVEEIWVHITSKSRSW